MQKGIYGLRRGGSKNLFKSKWIAFKAAIMEDLFAWNETDGKKRENGGGLRGGENWGKK